MRQVIQEKPLRAKGYLPGQNSLPVSYTDVQSAEWKSGRPAVNTVSELSDGLYTEYHCWCNQHRAERSEDTNNICLARKNDCRSAKASKIRQKRS